MTPIEMYYGILVKRDDLCFNPPAPPFSKCRGIIEHLKHLKHLGITTVGYTETSISMAGWGIVWACAQLDMTAVIFDPQYKITPPVLAYHREQWKKFNTIIIPIKAGMAKVNYYISKKILEKNYNRSVMLPLGLPFRETINATREEVINSKEKIKKVKTVVCCVGSGTIIAGVWQGLHNLNMYCDLYGIMTRTGNKDQKEAVIEQKARLSNEGMFSSTTKLILIDNGWEYTEHSEADCPFPCHEYYDLKAWAWLMLNQQSLEKPILFWNIGH